MNLAKIMHRLLKTNQRPLNLKTFWKWNTFRIVCKNKKVRNLANFLQKSKGKFRKKSQQPVDILIANVLLVGSNREIISNVFNYSQNKKV